MLFTDLSVESWIPPLQTVGSGCVHTRLQIAGKEGEGRRGGACREERLQLHW